MKRKNNKNKPLGATHWRHQADRTVTTRNRPRRTEEKVGSTEDQAETFA